MNLDDETILSAYLDDELDPAVRAEVAALLDADPALTERLDGLTVVHNAVAGLSRPAHGFSLSGLVMARIESAESVRRRRPLYWLATAASVAFAFALSVRSGLLGPARPAVEVLPTIVSNDVPTPSAPRVHGTESVASKAIVAPTTELPKPLGPVADPAEEGRQRVFEILDRPGMTLILVVTEVIDPTAGNRVHSLLRDSARKEVDFGRLTIPQGIVIDPEHPNHADVFAVDMDEPEREQFLSKVAHEFDSATHPATVQYTGLVSDPRLATQLAQIGDIVVGKGHPAAGLIPHPDPMLALKPSGSRDVTISPKGIVPDSPNRNANGDKARPAPSRQLVSEDANPKAQLVSRPAPVLVWVTSNQPSRLDD
jgi:hypothetical protein